MNVFAGRIAIVTGAASGIGRALAEALAERRARVVVSDIDGARASVVVASIERAGGEASVAVLDVTSADAVQSVVESTVATQGRLDYMVNNAGIGVGGEVRDLSLDHWRRIVDVNLWGVIHGVAAAYPVMVRQRSGHIVNIASLAGLGASPTMAPYATTKHAVVGLSTSLRAEGADLGVRVSVVCPGFVQSGIYDAATVVNARKDLLVARLPFRPIPATRAAAEILRGVEKNRSIIVFPFYARVLWRLRRLHPSLLARLEARMVRDFRTVRVRATDG
jgi:NAD(P)-dependent dehydrogenase (short-subunit alcohol dehydrogenase family)